MDEVERLRERIRLLEARLAERVEPPRFVAGEDDDVLRTLVDHLREVLFVRDPIKNRILFVSPVFEEIWGVPRQALYDNPHAFSAPVVPEDREAVMAAVRAQNEGVPFDLEYRIRTARGDIRWIFARTFFVERNGQPYRVVGLAEDITERKRAQESLLSLQADLSRQVEQRTAELRASLAEKELLLREIHHRVKNNLQLVSSLLYLQRERTPDAEARAALDASSERIQAIAYAHAALHQSSELSRVDLESYAEQIAGRLSSVFAEPALRVTVTSSEQIELPLDKAVPFGLVLNELLTNAHKHAFPGRPRGLVEVRVGRDGDLVTVTVQDDGVGLDPSALDRSETLGMRLVRTLVEQLEGSLSIHGAEGTRFEIRFRG